MWQLAIFLLVSPIVVHSFDGVQCGDYKCVNDVNVFCNTTTNTCQCRPGYIGNARLRCVIDTMHICTMMGDPHIRTFNHEDSAIYFPCTQILSEGDVPRAPPQKNLNYQITAITKEVYQARYASQIMVVALLIRLFTFDNNEIVLRCDTNGCWNNAAPYQKITNFVNQSLAVDVTRDAPNGQTVVNIQGYGPEVRFRAEDGSVTIAIPPDTVPNEQFPGLCNRPVDPVTFNADTATGLSLNYNDYIVYVNIGNINQDYETNPQCKRIYTTTCNPTQTLQRDSVKFCADVFADQSVKECYYNYRNQNGSVVLFDFNNCHEAICGTAVPTAFCNDVVMACGVDKIPADAGCPPPVK
ncbi:uncharacterized protein LOC126823429 [Patella vulgata]|uniref:uncharacterized protein LOC126823429 n=1 Tax=Patella vulgata TaxID=6465 RepID=UPI00217F75FB|nr:uncharacterized protein LOC126823429 [Patella vulgata]